MIHLSRIRSIAMVCFGNSLRNGPTPAPDSLRHPEPGGRGRSLSQVPEEDSIGDTQWVMKNDTPNLTQNAWLGREVTGGKDLLRGKPGREGAIASAPPRPARTATVPPGEVAIAYSHGRYQTGGSETPTAGGWWLWSDGTRAPTPLRREPARSPPRGPDRWP